MNNVVWGTSQDWTTDANSWRSSKWAEYIVTPNETYFENQQKN